MDKVDPLLKNVHEFVAFARKRLGDPELAADAVQESLLKALNAADQIRDDENAKARFYRILRRTIIDLYRRRDARDRAVAALERELNSPADQEEARVVCACMERLLPIMTPEYSVLLQRIDLNEESPDSVAARLGITRNNLNVRLHRARQQLKRRLEENCRARTPRIRSKVRLSLVCAKHGCLDCQCGSDAKRRE